MMLKRTFRSLILLAASASGAFVISAQSRNLLQNPTANQGSEFWRVFGEASVEPVSGGNSCFVVRNGGYFIQDVSLPDDAVGQYAV